MLQPMFASAIKSDVCKVPKNILKPRTVSFQEGEDDVTICAKATVTCLKNIQVAPVHEKLTVTVPKGKEAGILGAFPCAIQIGSLIFKVPPQLEEVRPNFRTPPEKVLI